ncbi:MAG: glycosyltransferase family 39 protein, partial [Acidobacteriota bacterium]
APAIRRGVFARTSLAVSRIRVAFWYVELIRDGLHPMMKESCVTSPEPTAGLSSLFSRAASLLDRRPGIRLVLLVAAAVRIVSIFLLRSFLHPVTWEFGEIATTIRAGLGYTIVLPNGGRAPSAYMPPAYPYLLVPVMKFGGSGWIGWLLLELVQAALGVLLVYVIYRTALLLMPRRVAILAAILVAVYPTQVYTCNEFHSINFYMVLSAAVVLFLTRYVERTGAWSDIVFAGLSGGILMLFRAEAPALLLLFAVILLWRRGRKAAVPAAAFLIVAALCLAPWIIRNYRVFGRLVPVTVSAGYNLWIGNNPHATGSQHVQLVIPGPLQRELDRARQDRDYQIHRDKIFERDAIHFALDHPIEDARVDLRKLVIFFVFDPAHEKSRRPLYWVPSVILSLFALYGAWIRRRNLLREDLFLVTSILFAVAVTAAVFALPRYKIVIDPFLMIFAANCISTASSPAQGQRTAKFPPSAT